MFPKLSRRNSQLCRESTSSKKIRHPDLVEGQSIHQKRPSSRAGRGISSVRRESASPKSVILSLSKDQFSSARKRLPNKTPSSRTFRRINSARRESAYPKIRHPELVEGSASGSSHHFLPFPHHRHPELVEGSDALAQKVAQPRSLIPPPQKRPSSRADESVQLGAKAPTQKSVILSLSKDL